MIVSDVKAAIASVPEVESVTADGLIGDYDELCWKVGDGVNQAADLISATASIPSLNFTPLMTLGNWF
jgi:hypothetical protein